MGHGHGGHCHTGGGHHGGHHGGNHCHNHHNNHAGALLLGAAIVANNNNQRRHQEQQRLLEDERQRAYQAEQRREEERRREQQRLLEAERVARQEAERKLRIQTAYSAAETALSSNNHELAISAFENLLEESLSNEMFCNVHEKLALLYVDKQDYMRAADHYLQIKNSANYLSGSSKVTVALIQKTNDILNTINVDSLESVEDCDIILLQLDYAKRYSEKANQLSSVPLSWSKVGEKTQAVTTKRTKIKDLATLNQILTSLNAIEQQSYSVYDEGTAALRSLDLVKRDITSLTTISHDAYLVRHDNEYTRAHQACFALKVAEFNQLYVTLINTCPQTQNPQDYKNHLDRLYDAQKVMDAVLWHVCNIQSPGDKHAWTQCGENLSRTIRYTQAEQHCVDVGIKINRMPTPQSMNLDIALAWAKDLSGEVSRLDQDASALGGSSVQLKGTVGNILSSVYQKIFELRLSLMIENCFAESTRNFEVTEDDATTIKNVIAAAANDQMRGDVRGAIVSEDPAKFQQQIHGVTTALTQFYSHRSSFFCCKSDVLKLSANFADQAKIEVQEAIHSKRRYQG